METSVYAWRPVILEEGIQTTIHSEQDETKMDFFFSFLFANLRQQTTGHQLF